MKKPRMDEVTLKFNENYFDQFCHKVQKASTY